MSSCDARERLETRRVSRRSATRLVVPYTVPYALRYYIVNRLLSWLGLSPSGGRVGFRRCAAHWGVIFRVGAGFIFTTAHQIVTGVVFISTAHQIVTGGVSIFATTVVVRGQPPRCRVRRAVLEWDAPVQSPRSPA